MNYYWAYWSDGVVKVRRSKDDRLWSFPNMDLAIDHMIMGWRN